MFAAYELAARNRHLKLLKLYEKHFGLSLRPKDLIAFLRPQYNQRAGTGPRCTVFTLYGGQREQAHCRPAALVEVDSRLTSVTAVCNHHQPAR
jgi:hypothetical protein